MGRLSVSVDIFEILALAWDHPLIAGMFMLMFTPPFFPVLVFFSPLLISTALCAAALISMGQQIDDASKREREVAGWNARGPTDGDPPAPRERPIRRRRVPGEDNWLDWVRGSLDPGSVWGQTESSTFIEDVKEERLLADFRVDEGGIDMKEEEYRQQIEAFRAFERNLGERSFSFRTGAAVAATIDALDSPVEDPSMRLVPFQNTISSPQIPPMFLYTLRTGGTGNGASSAIGNLTEAGSGEQRPPRPTQQPQPQPQLQGGQEQQQQQKTLVPYGSGFSSGSFGDPENDKQRQLQLQPESQQLQQKQILGSFGSRFYSGGLEELKKVNERQHHAPQQQENMLVPFSSGSIIGSLEGPKKDNQQRRRHQHQHGELLSLGSEIIKGSFKEPEQQQHNQRGISSQTQVSPAEPAHSLTSVAKGSSAEAAYSSRSASKGSSSTQNPVKSSHVDSRDSDRRTTIFDYGEDRGDAKHKAKPSQERLKGLTYNASLIPGNAVIYTAEPSPVDSKQLQKRNSLSSRERRGLSTTPRQRRKHEMAVRHALQFEKENSSAGSWITTTNAARRE